MLIILWGYRKYSYTVGSRTFFRLLGLFSINRYNGKNGMNDLNWSLHVVLF